jgi:hypothetical protein
VKDVIKYFISYLIGKEQLFNGEGNMPSGARLEAQGSLHHVKVPNVFSSSLTGIFRVSQELAE